MGMIPRGDSGQATVELAVLLPVVLVVALVSCNMMLYLSECARFDRLARNAIRICATSPSYGEDAGACAAAAEALLAEQMNSERVVCSVSVSYESGLERYVAKMDYRPTLFGGNFRGEVFGVTLSPLSHEVGLVVDPYDAGVIA